MIQHVCEAASAAETITRVVVATDDERIFDAVARFGGEPIMTSAAHVNGTSRVAEAADLLGLSPEIIVVNVQGDEPEIEPGIIDLAVTTLRGSDAPMATIASPFAPGEEASDPNIVKVVLRADGSALYFSRALIPHRCDGTGAGSLKHVGLYAYRRWFLPEYTALEPTPLEQAERLEQLRALEHGLVIAVGTARSAHQGIDTPEQYEAFARRWRAAHRTGA